MVITPANDTADVIQPYLARVIRPATQTAQPLPIVLVRQATADAEERNASWLYRPIFVQSSGPTPSTGTPDVCYVACARDTEFTSVNRGSSFSAAARDSQYTATGGKG
jgi:hypothetical protein